MCTVSDYAAESTLANWSGAANASAGSYRYFSDEQGTVHGSIQAWPSVRRGKRKYRSITATYATNRVTVRSIHAQPSSRTKPT